VDLLTLNHPDDVFVFLGKKTGTTGPPSCREPELTAREQQDEHQDRPHAGPKPAEVQRENVRNRTTPGRTAPERDDFAPDITRRGNT